MSKKRRMRRVREKMMRKRKMRKRRRRIFKMKGEKRIMERE